MSYENQPSYWKRNKIEEKYNRYITILQWLFVGAMILGLELLFVNAI